MMGMMSIFPLGSRGQSDDVFRLHLPHHLFKSKCRQMVTFVNNHLTILCHEVSYPFLVVGALKNGNIHATTAFGRPSSDLADRLCGTAEKHYQSCMPCVLPVSRSDKKWYLYRRGSAS